MCVVTINKFNYFGVYRFWKPLLLFCSMAKESPFMYFLITWLKSLCILIHSLWCCGKENFDAVREEEMWTALDMHGCAQFSRS